MDGAGDLQGARRAHSSGFLSCSPGLPVSTDLDAVHAHCGAPREIKPSLREFETLLAAGDKSLVEA